MMSRNYGLKEPRLMYSQQDFTDGCFFNLCLGVGIGIAATIVAELLFAYFHGWIW